MIKCIYLFYFILVPDQRVRRNEADSHQQKNQKVEKEGEIHIKESAEGNAEVKLELKDKFLTRYLRRQLNFYQL